MEGEEGESAAAALFQAHCLAFGGLAASGERPLIADVQEPQRCSTMCLFPDEPQLQKCQI